MALLSFGIRAQSLEDQQALIDRVRGEVGEPGAPGGPPAGVDGAARRAAGDRRRGRLRSLHQPLLADACRAGRGGAGAACGLPLLGRALVPLVPVVLATGWSALVLWLSRHPAQPDVGGAGGADDRDRHRVQRDPRGSLPRGAGWGARCRRGPATLPTRAPGPRCSPPAATAIAGFAVLIASDVPMLRDFGFVTVIDLAVALLGVMVVLPAALVWS